MAVAEQNDQVNQFNMEGFGGVLRTDVRDNRDLVRRTEQKKEIIYTIDGMPVIECSGCPHHRPLHIDGCAVGAHNPDGTCNFVLIFEAFEKFREWYIQ